MKKTLLLWLCLAFHTWSIAQQNSEILEGFILSPFGDPVPGANILVKGSTTGTVSDVNGKFTLSLAHGSYVLEVSYIGFGTVRREISIPFHGILEIHLEEDGIGLSEVEVFSTGYQQLPKERSTGSFVLLNRELVDRRVSTNLLDRLEDITTGMLFSKDRSGNLTDVSIRGTSTIFADRNPLIIIDNFPYDGPLENINPNDVENITVLKDAAAASIWGARAGNGVIVITTKKGKKGAVPRVSFNSNFNIIERPDPFHQEMMSIDDFIGWERALFDRGFYTPRENSPLRVLLPPVVETLILQRDGLITAQEAENRINQFAAQDTRSELQDHYYRQAFNRQYALNVSGGSDNFRYMNSVGYDNNAESVIGQDNSRITLNSQTNWNLMDKRLEIGAGIYYSIIANNQSTQVPQGTLSPYLKFTDEAGFPQTVPRDFRTTFTESAESLGLLDWGYRPLEEIGQYRSSVSSNDLRLNALMAYKFTDGLRAEVSYQYWSNQQTGKNINDPDSYFVRNLVNSFTQVDPGTGNLTRQVPMGGIMDFRNSSAYSHNLRARIDYHRTWSDSHEFTGLLGFELRDYQGLGNTARFYGYNDELGTSLPVNFNTQYRQFANNLLGTIPTGVSHSGQIDRFLSAFSNISYSYRKKYTLTASARKDASNLFGIDTNQKWVPLWSVGGSWLISGEELYNVPWMPYLRLRSTYGYNGNIDKSVSAYTTALVMPGSFNSLSRLQYLQLRNPPNPELRWEKIGVTNIGLEFESRESIIRGSIELFRKNATDLIGERPFPTTTGVNNLRGNFADMVTKGIDLELTSLNIDRGLTWRTVFFLSRVVDEITGFDREQPVFEYPGYGAGAPGISPRPRLGYPLHSLYSFQWGGLDPANGNPRGVLGGEPSTNLTAVYLQTELEDLVFHGNARPQTFGSLRNDFGWKNFLLSFNITYRLDYYFRRNPIHYGLLFAGRLQPAEYADRWQNPGDELTTNVPSAPLASNTIRDIIYNDSEIHVLKGDHIRFQDIRLAYNLSSNNFRKLPFDRMEIYSYINNVGVLWRANSEFRDPDYRFDKALRSIAFGVRLDF